MSGGRDSRNFRTSSTPRGGQIPAGRPNPPPQRANGAVERASFQSEGENKRVDLARIAWLVTVGLCLIAVLVLVLYGYIGYAAVTLAVAVAAAINLF